MRTLFVSLALLTIGGSAASAQAPSQLVQLPNGSIGVVSADGVYLGQLRASLDGSTGLAGEARHQSYVIIPNSPTPQMSAVQQIAAQHAAATATPKPPPVKTTRIFHGLGNGVFMDAPVAHSP